MVMMGWFVSHPGSQNRTYSRFHNPGIADMILGE